jgi:hypothetical protein
MVLWIHIFFTSNLAPAFHDFGLDLRLPHCGLVQLLVRNELCLLQSLERLPFDPHVIYSHFGRGEQIDDVDKK